MILLIKETKQRWCLSIIHLNDFSYKENRKRKILNRLFFLKNNLQRTKKRVEKLSNFITIVYCKIGTRVIFIVVDISMD